MPFIEARDGTSLFYKVWGTGKPVVFIHGWGLSADMWEYQMPFFVDRGLRCIAYDQRGCGRSDEPCHGYDFDTLADDPSALLEHLDLREATLASHSMGGGEVARYLSRYGTGRVEKAALIASATPYLLNTPDNPEGVDKSVFDGIAAALRSDRPGFLGVNAPAAFGTNLPDVSVSSELMNWAMGIFLQTSPMASLDTLRLYSETDLRPDMSAFTIPTLLIHGRQDPLVPLEASSQRTVRMIPGTVAELAIESFFPADTETESVLRRRS
jgi:non-heme chloroperoxidase